MVVHEQTRSSYQTLVQAGARVFEYSPSYVHSKVFIADGVYGVCGTINLDYRSLHLHYECAVWLYQSQAVQEILADFNETFPQCTEITLEQCRQVRVMRRIVRGILKFISPLM